MDTQMLIGSKFENGAETEEPILNPKTGATVAVPAKRVPFFQAGKELKELLTQ